VLLPFDGEIKMYILSWTHRA